MTENTFDKFYYYIYPYLIGLLSLLTVVLILLRIKHYKIQGKEYPFIIRKSLLAYHIVLDGAKKITQNVLDNLARILPSNIKVALSPNNDKLKSIILKNQKTITHIYAIALVPVAFFISRNIFHKGILFFPVFILIAGTIRSLNKLLSYLTGNAIYMVCPTCGYANNKLVDHCGFCANAGLAAVKADNQFPALSLQDEIAEYRKADAYREVSEPILKGLNLPKSEVILIYKQVSPIKRNGNRFLLDVNGYPCTLNAICLTSHKIYFIAGAFGGWRIIDSYPYPDIVGYQTGTRVMSDPMELIDDIDKLTIKTENGNEYLLRGFNPKKLFLAIKSCIKRRQSSYSVNSKVLEHTDK